MKTKKFRVVFFIGVFLSLSGAWAYAEEISKEFHEEFDADKNTVLTLNDLASGLYTVNITVDGVITTERLVVEK